MSTATRAADVGDIEDLAELAPDHVSRRHAHQRQHQRAAGRRRRRRDRVGRGVRRARPPARLAAGRQRHARRRRARGGARPGRGAREAAAHQQWLHPRPAGAGRDVGDLGRAGAGGARRLRPRRGRAQPRRRRAGARLSAGGGERGQRRAAVHAPGPRPAGRAGRATAPSLRAPSADWASPRCSRRSEASHATAAIRKDFCEALHSQRAAFSRLRSRRIFQ